MDHKKCSISTGICGSITAGQGELDDNGYWERPCLECANRANSREVQRLSRIKNELWDLLSSAPREGVVLEALKIMQA